MKKQVLSLFMAFVLCFSMLPMSAFAADETVNSHTHDETEWTATDSLPSEPGSYYLTQSVTSNWTVPEGDFKLCLNGQAFLAASQLVPVLH